MNPYISIIIPVYNTEKYLRTCIDSIVNQRDNYNDFEVILIDDGSTDRSSSICDEYIKYDFIKIYHVENGGVARARNIGLANSSGKYILFVDSDDFINENSLNRIAFDCKRQNEPDLIFLSGNKLLKDRIESIDTALLEERIINQTRENVFLYLASRNKFQGSPCLKMTKRNLLIDNSLFFPEGRRVEDLDWCMNVILQANTYGVANVDYYFYRQNVVNSNSNTFNENSYSDFKYIIDKWIALANSEKNENIRNGIYKFACYEYCILLMHSYVFLKDDIDWHRPKIFLFKYNKSKKIRIIRIMVKIMGYRATSKIINYIYKCKNV